LKGGDASFLTAGVQIIKDLRTEIASGEWRRQQTEGDRLSFAEL
jgi:hypothetical protein